jgi:hypothetical protein
MKKILLATSILAASATIANAQAVTITGEGRMGVQFQNFGVWTWNQENRLRLDFNVEVEADHGLTFGAWTRAEMSSTGAGAGIFSESRVWVQSGAVTLTFGNADGAIAGYGYSHGWLGGCGVGYEGGQLCGDAAGLDTATHQEISNGPIPAPQVLLTYEGSNYVVAISHQDNISTEIGGNVSFGAWTFGAGYTDLFDIYTVSGHYDGGSWGVGAIVAANSFVTNWSVSATVAALGGEFYGYVGEVFGDESYGLSFGYDLGGGASVVAGAEHIGGVTNATTGSVGVVFTF